MFINALFYHTTPSEALFRKLAKTSRKHEKSPEKSSQNDTMIDENLT